MQMDCIAKYDCRYFIFINRNLSKIFVLPGVKALKIRITRPFVRHYPKNFVSFGQMVLITVFIDLTPILNLFGISEHLNLMRMT